MRCLGQVRLRSISVLSTEMYKICHALRIVYFCLPSRCCFRGDGADRQCGGVGSCSRTVLASRGSVVSCISIRRCGKDDGFALRSAPKSGCSAHFLDASDKSGVAMGG